MKYLCFTLEKLPHNRQTIKGTPNYPKLEAIFHGFIQHEDSICQFNPLTTGTEPRLPQLWSKRLYQVRTFARRYFSFLVCHNLKKKIAHVRTTFFMRTDIAQNTYHTYHPAETINGLPT